MKKENFFVAKPIISSIQSAEVELERTESLLKNKDYIMSGTCGVVCVEVSKIQEEAKKYQLTFLQKRLKKFIQEQESKLAKL